ncbi:MAG: hypothetical protein D6773_03515 [Alphaproteobacteria bacterium]|nr:MAG: hypothetical protein D6773_03515 [Alphaproteobacteria bacterium]
MKAVYQAKNIGEIVEHIRALAAENHEQASGNRVLKLEARYLNGMADGLSAAADILENTNLTG